MCSDPSTVPKRVSINMCSILVMGNYLETLNLFFGGFTLTFCVITSMYLSWGGEIGSNFSGHIGWSWWGWCSWYKPGERFIFELYSHMYFTHGVSYPDTFFPFYIGGPHKVKKRTGITLAVFTHILCFTAQTGDKQMMCITLMLVLYTREEIGKVSLMENLWLLSKWNRIL